MVDFLFMMFVLIFMYVTLLLQGWSGINILVITLGAKKRRPINISHLQVSTSTELQSTIDALLKLGFTLLGQVRVNIPGVQAGDSRVFVSSDKLTHAEVTEVMADMVGFTTVYADHAVVETSFPMGERIDTPTFRSHTISSDIERAYLYHLQQVADFSKPHGIPRRLESMNDYLYWDIVYRERYVWQKFRRNFWMGVIKVLALIYVLVATGIVLGSGAPHDRMTPYTQLFPLLNLITPVALVTYVLPFLARWASRREMKTT